MLKIILFSLLVIPSLANAKEMINENRDSIRLGGEVVKMETSTKDTKNRGAYTIEGRYHLTLLPSPLFIGSKFSFDTEDEKDSLRVDVKNNYYNFYGFIGAEYVYLLRFSAVIGPSYIYENIKIVYEGEKENLTDHGYGLFIQGNIDYAFTTYAELTLFAFHHMKINYERDDFGYGFNVAYNF